MLPFFKSAIFNIVMGVIASALYAVLTQGGASIQLERLTVGLVTLPAVFVGLGMFCGLLVFYNIIHLLEVLFTHLGFFDGIDLS